MDASDFPSMSTENAHKLLTLLFESLRTPVAAALERAQTANVVDVPHIDFAAITFTSVVETIHMRADATPAGTAHKEVMVEHLINMLLNGWLKR
jgi:hypothetical protein